MAAYRNNNRASSHIFTGLGDAPWMWLGMHASQIPNPPQRTRLDMEALKTSSFMYTVLARAKNGQMMGNNGVAFRGDYKSLNGFLGFIFMGTADRVDITNLRELLVKKVDLGCKDSDWGRTPQVKVGAQEVLVHLVFKDLKAIPKDSPFVTVTKEGKRHIIGIGELFGFRFENVDANGFGDRVPYVNPNKDAIVAKLGAIQQRREEFMKAKAKAAELENEEEFEVETPEDDSDNPLA